MYSRTSHPRKRLALPAAPAQHHIRPPAQPPALPGWCRKSACTHCKPERPPVWPPTANRVRTCSSGTIATRRPPGPPNPPAPPPPPEPPRAWKRFRATNEKTNRNPYICCGAARPLGRWPAIHRTSPSSSQPTHPFIPTVSMHTSASATAPVTTPLNIRQRRPQNSINTGIAISVGLNSASASARPARNLRFLARQNTKSATAKKPTTEICPPIQLSMRNGIEEIPAETQSSSARRKAGQNPATELLLPRREPAKSQATPHMPTDRKVRRMAGRSAPRRGRWRTPASDP